MWQLLESLILQPLFVVFNLVLSVWILFEFQRRYAGRHPLGFAAGIYLFPLVPLVPWILAFRVFTTYTNHVRIERRRVNRMAIKFGGLLFAGGVCLILGFALLAGSVWVSRDGMGQIVVVLCILIALSLTCFGFALRAGIRCTSTMKNAEQAAP